ncbi:heparinase II/III domain-containing protein [Cohnella fermenti]|uniref:Heparinase II/III-like C-terminal domain-containing protein n=1 Tax=Cohnella fermenti TaxID=2565925 RepID=A0A4S4C8P6_9BACL|nr:heparinase II/III family protein [Cohnella fermenti]THF82131.1 hypothetical protein E6C55_07030 [Cohnella fermenti]
MGLFMRDMKNERGRIAGAAGRSKELWEALADRVAAHSRMPGLVQPGDTQQWWHLVWERLGDAAFVYAVRPDDALGAWLRETVLDICRKPADEWVGPWFRQRGDPQAGMLETAHVSVAIAVAIDLCPALFADEMAAIRGALRSKGMEPCRRALEATASAKGPINNWFMALLNGFGTAAAVLGDREAVRAAADYYRTATTLYNEDSYGESLQYGNYASLHLSHLREVLIRYEPAFEEELDAGCFAKLMDWFAASFIHVKPLEGWGAEPYPRTVNFGDSSAILRPSGDFLLHVASRCRDRFPAEAGLARWLFERTYANPRIGTNEGATFGFRNDFQFLSLLLYPDAAEPLSPERAGLPLLSSFEAGSVIARNRWENPLTLLAVQGGFEPLRASSHRHEDQNSFILAHLGERFFVDPGHCCYRLNTQRASTATGAHNTWSFEAEGKDGIPVAIRQKPADGNAFKPTSSFGRKRIVREMDGIHVVRSDAAELYEAPITRAERTWIAAMPHVLFMIDVIESEQPVKVRTHFVLNNRDNRLQTNVAAETKLVFRRNGAGMKFFQVSAMSGDEANRNGLSFDWGHVHDCYHPLPNQKGQGAEGSASVFQYTSEAYRKRHTIVYVAAMDDRDTIRSWHIVPLSGRHFHAEPPGGSGGYSLELTDDDGLIVYDYGSDRKYGIRGDDFTAIRNG